MTIAAIVFWCSITLVVFAYAGYPLLIWIASRRTPDETQSGPDAFESRSARDWPFVSLVIAAYKEESVILPRLQNAIDLDYPADRFEIIVGCDGREDCTGDLVQSFGDSRIRLIQFPQRRGKASVLNDCVPQARGNIVVLSDANTVMHPDAIRRLVRHFDDPSVGGVCGKLNLTDPITGKNVDGIYWKYENFLKRCEARLGALLGTNGGIYAIRKPLYRPIPANTIVDDFVIGMRVHQEGYRLLYDATAEAFEETAPTISDEFHRRARIGAGGFQSLIWLKSLLNPRHGWLAFAFFSHKVLRWTCPAFLIFAIVANLILIRQPLYAQIAMAHVAFYLAAYAGSRLTSGGRWQRPLRLPSMFVSMNLALVVGFWRWITGSQGGAWKRTERAGEPAPAATGDDKTVTAECLNSDANI